MKVSKDELDHFGRVLSNITFNAAEKNKSFIAFPIQNETKEEIDDLELVVKPNNTGVAKDPVPALVLGPDKVKLGYVDLTYARNFNILLYSELIGHRLSKTTAEELRNIDCFLIEEPYMLALFNF